MTPDPHQPHLPVSMPETAEDTLRIIANLPVPEGLEDRVHRVLRRTHQGRILPWPAAPRPQSNWIRSAAAAAIVFVVAGGGWGVYTRVGPRQPAKVLFMPRVSAGGGFSGAGAIRAPKTVPGPSAPQLKKTNDAKKQVAKTQLKGGMTGQSTPQK